MADRLPAAIRLLMPAPVLPPGGPPRTNALESGQRRSAEELQQAIERVHREALAAEARSAQLRRAAAIARDQAYEVRASWQWSGHQRTAIAEELATLTKEANTVATEQRTLSEQARGAMRDAAAWDGWIAQLRQDAKRLAEEGKQDDADAAELRADDGHGQAAQLRDWLERAEQRFRSLGARLDALATRRDEKAGAGRELASRQQQLVGRYQQLDADAQRMEREAAEQATTALLARLEARERVIDLVGLRPELCRWVNGPAPASAGVEPPEPIAGGGTITQLRLDGAPVSVQSVKGQPPPVHHPLVKDALNRLPVEFRERGYECCSETGAISAALMAEDARRAKTGAAVTTLNEARKQVFLGADLVTYRMREQDVVAGAPCLSCLAVLAYFGFDIVPPELLNV